jgi:hypothetical protein
MRKNAMIILLVLLALSRAGVGVSQVKTHAGIQPEGQSSLPPVPGLYSCVLELEGRPYVEEEASSCLQSILKIPYFDGGRVETTHTGSGTILNFILRAPALRLTHVNLGIPATWMQDFIQYSEKKYPILHEGDSYNSNRDGNTSVTLRGFMESKGERVVVSRTIYLDYITKTAKVDFHIARAPGGTPFNFPATSETDCAVHVRSFLELDIDDFTPLPLVESMSRTRFSYCFLDSVVQGDEDRLRKTGIFKAASYSVSGSGDSRDISLNIRTKPLEIIEVNVHGHGQLSDEGIKMRPRLEFRANQVYHRSNAQRAGDELKAFYSRPDNQVKVFEDDEIVSRDKIRVTFHVVVGSKDEVIIDGKMIEGGMLNSGPSQK